MDSKLEFEDWVGQLVEVVIDRPIGTSHPDYADMVYPVNYGYIPGTTAPDGHAIDVYVLGVDRPLRRCLGEVVAIIRRRDDVEDKLVVSLSGEWSKDEIGELTAFQEKWFDTWIEMPEDGRRSVSCGFCRAS